MLACLLLACMFASLHVIKQSPDIWSASGPQCRHTPITLQRCLIPCNQQPRISCESFEFIFHFLLLLHLGIVKAFLSFLYGVLGSDSGQLVFPAR